MKFNGTLMNLYVLDSAPTTPSEIDEYTRVGHTKDLSMPASRTLIDLSDKDSGLDGDAVAGRRSEKISCTLNLDDTDEGQTMLRTVFKSTRGELWFLCTQDLPGTRQYWGKAIIEDAGRDFPEEQAAKFSFSATVVGGVQDGLAPVS